jgi:rubrerythrin
MSRKVNRSPEAIERHNQKWSTRYQVTAQLRDRYPDEFRKLRAGVTYIVALRLLRERHPDEFDGLLTVYEPPRVPERLRSALSCAICGQPLAGHALGSHR